MNVDDKLYKWKYVLNEPDWYVRLLPELKEVLAFVSTQTPDAKLKLKNQVYNFFEQEIKAGNVKFASTGYNFDAERKPIDTVVIHHTENLPSITWQRVNVTHMLKLYVPYYANPTLPQEMHIKGTPLYSGHTRAGKQVFYSYHWLVRNDGSFERLLHDNETGWHAGNWDVNCRSVGIALDNDYTNSKPSSGELKAIVKLIKENYSGVLKQNIIGHGEVNNKTCPSNLFLSKNGVRGWKEDLLALL
ncbi:MAG: N-acetylmuramoyl-L-alanine amidase [Candidatus Vogelbacteria bacterium]|nr:N-acetylmuramoyl-L-alanine amidase [Candidatus Vogelbacteria bacterium]